MNTNINHQGRTLHVQTEDSGHEHGRIITHLFLSGSIIATKRVEYQRSAEDHDLKVMIKDQHRQMIESIAKGDYDKTILLARPKKREAGRPIPLARKKHIPQVLNAEVRPQNRVDRPSEVAERVRRGPWAFPKLESSGNDTFLTSNEPDDESSS